MMNTAERKPAGSREDVAEEWTAEALSGGTFTRYVRALAARSESLTRLADELIIELRRALVREMHHRSLWTSSPSYVGIYGCAEWAPPPEEERTATPLDEILADCYAFIFARKLDRLYNKIRLGQTIDGLVVVYLRRFLHERQKLHDPLGYRLFEVLNAAVRSAVETDGLRILKGDPKIRNDTFLAVAPGGISDASAPLEVLRPIVARWNSALLPGLVIASGKKRAGLEARLRGYLFDLESEGVTAFCFKELLDAMKDDVRARWAALYDQGEGESAVEMESEDAATVMRVFRPDCRWEDAEGFKKLVECVADRIDTSGGQERTRGHLKRLWDFLRHLVLVEECVPPQRRLAETLDIPRGRFTELYETLGQMARRCQGILSGNVVEMGSRRGGHDG